MRLERIVARGARFAEPGAGRTRLMSSEKIVSERQRYSSGSKWEPIVGYSRAIRQGNLIWVTGTTATNDKGEIVGIGDARAQTLQALRNIETALKALGSGLQDVVRTRMFVTDIS